MTVAPPAPRRPRAIVFAFACEPGRGSEPGAGWGVVQALADVADCTVLVGPEHEPAIHRWEESNPTSSALRFVTVPDARRSTPVRRGRLGWFAAYLRWLERAEQEAKALHRLHPFDVACHASYSTYWLPSPAVSLGMPSLWGPVGGAVTTPFPLWPMLGAAGVAGELVDLTAVHLCAMLPAVRRTWLRATVRVLQNEETRQRLPVALGAGSLVLNHALLVDVPPASGAARTRGREILFVAALERRKGPALALRALAHTPPDVRLTVVGDGPARRSLDGLARRLGVADRVDWLGAVPRVRLFEALDHAAAALFTGLREEGGLALAEAMVRGTPVIVLSHGGAKTIAEANTDPSRVVLVSPGPPDATARALAAAMTRMARTPLCAAGPLLDQKAARRALGEALLRAIALGAADGERGVPGEPDRRRSGAARTSTAGRPAQ